jgi:hypothetical protein
MPLWYTVLSVPGLIGRSFLADQKRKDTAKYRYVGRGPIDTEEASLSSEEAGGAPISRSHKFCVALFLAARRLFSPIAMPSSLPAKRLYLKGTSFCIVLVVRL